jgi:transposase-like protein
VSDRERRVFPDAFERGAVERVRRSGMTIVAVAGEPGPHETVLQRRVARFGGSTTASPAGRLPAAASVMPSPADLAAENARLEREPHRAETERDVPKRAAAAIVACPSLQHSDRGVQHAAGACRQVLAAAGTTSSM